ncbi:hypothetical protein HNY73_009693 [Argiope bruennichi]|uniref:Gustatory receptor n=1 Tax=Argiope bruennichi TaxID=94029 RepID=A0A8T0FCW3_ARGBR|nr:hypothetical protein HNY73_009693 [Argiope bruennichi]
MAVKKNGYQVQWALERIVSVTSSILVILLVSRKRYEFKTAMKKVQFIKNSASEKKINVLAGCILASPLIYSLATLLAYAIERDETGFRFFFYGFPVTDKVLKCFILFWKSFVYYFLFPTYSNSFILIFCVIFYGLSLHIRNLSQELERCPPKDFTTAIQIKYLDCRKEIIKMLEELQTHFSSVSFIACGGHFSYCFAVLTQILLYSFNENSVTYHFDSTMNLVFVGVPLVLMFWIPEQIPLEMENLNKIICSKYEVRASSGIVSECPTIEKLMLEEKIFVVSGCSMISFRRRHILSILGTVLTYGLLVMGLEVRN